MWHNVILCAIVWREGIYIEFWCVVPLFYILIKASSDRDVTVCITIVSSSVVVALLLTGIISRHCRCKIQFRFHRFKLCIRARWFLLQPLDSTEWPFTESSVPWQVLAHKNNRQEHELNHRYECECGLGCPGVKNVCLWPLDSIVHGSFR